MSKGLEEMFACSCANHHVSGLGFKKVELCQFDNLTDPAK